ncbi:hypothetical protein CoNPh15_CDS0003 [Staphylococcus phage S-CoN_Ph15]|nr:hypothetical protein CoNPh14_CDS0165 [Staphylococcus phage S-CoN_Ph14]WNM53850.1 hypothetical protein CoNPh15_CDS0003 [Staphylococcus phage S-CoN_Ph15]WNM54194.1 hypothetical protein CoNPh16_CDS0180 [Staphylococcus phage S-CoN_Ph16]
MDIGKVYYVIMKDGKMFEREARVFGSGEVFSTTLMTTQDITQAKVYTDCKDTTRDAEHYGFEVKTVKIDIKSL